MIYQILLNMIETHKQAIAQDLIDRADRQIGRVDKATPNGSVELRVRAIVTWLDTVLTYIRDGDTEVWKAAITEQIERIARYNYTLEEMVQVITGFHKAIDNLIDQELPLDKDPQNAKLRERFHRRVQGLNTSSSTIIGVVFMRIQQANS